MLQTETNTRAMERRIRAAFRAVTLRCGRMETTFEHGQWWVSLPNSGAQWSVVDASGPGSVDGFGFELVTEGEDE